jgi:hypothetical protein
MNHGNWAIPADAVLSRNPKVSYRDLEEGGVLLHLETGAYHGLNPTGSAIWKILDEDLPCAAVLARLRGSLDDPSALVEADVTKFLAGMVERDLLQRRDA